MYSKGSATPSASAGATGGALATAQSLLLRPHAHAHLTHNQNAHNAQRDPAYGTTNGARPGPAGACSTTDINCTAARKKERKFIF